MIVAALLRRHNLGICRARSLLERAHRSVSQAATNSDAEPRIASEPACCKPSRQPCLWLSRGACLRPQAFDRDSAGLESDVRTTGDAAKFLTRPSSDQCVRVGVLHRTPQHRPRRGHHFRRGRRRCERPFADSLPAPYDNKTPQIQDLAGCAQPDCRQLLTSRRMAPRPADGSDSAPGPRSDEGRSLPSSD